ncbi:MAG: hypothetical protein KBD78_11200 [Oligoflexales bacterium]|nr:hypothetical protein [Oligoflexales bacterium]
MEKEPPRKSRSENSKEPRKGESITIQFQVGKNPTRSMQFSPQKLFILLFASMTITFMGIAGLAFLAKDFNYTKFSALFLRGSEILNGEKSMPKHAVELKSKNSAVPQSTTMPHSSTKVQTAEIRKSKKKNDSQPRKSSDQANEINIPDEKIPNKLSSASKSILDKIFKTDPNIDFAGSPYFKAQVKNIRIHDNRELWLKLILTNNKKFSHLRGKIGALIQATHSDYNYEVYWIENRFENFSSFDLALKVALVKDYSFRSEVEKEFSFPIRRLNLNQYKNFTAKIFLNDRNFNHIQTIDISSWLDDLKSTESKNMNFAH